MTALEIKRFRDQHDLTQEQLAEITGVGIGTVASWEQGKRNISKSAKLLLQHFERNQNNVLPKEDGFSYSEKDKTINGIPLISIDAIAGWGTGSFQVMEYDTERYVVPEFEELKVDFMIRVKGSSMYPKYSSGDLVACKKLPLDTFFQWNKVYVLDTVQGAMIKRVKKSVQEEHIQCVSDNKDYEAFDLDLKEVHSLSIVLGVIRLE